MQPCGRVAPPEAGRHASARLIGIPADPPVFFHCATPFGMRKKLQRCSHLSTDRTTRSGYRGRRAHVASRQHTREFLQHLSIAYGSLAELEPHIEMARRLSYLETEQADALHHSCATL